MAVEAGTLGAAFLNAALEGKNDWWRYVVGLALAVGGTLGSAFGLGVLLLAWVLVDGNPATTIDTQTGTLLGLDPVAPFAVGLLAYLGAFVAIIVAVRLVHGRPVRSLVTPRPRVNGWRVLHGGLAWAALVAAASVLEALIFPGRYRLAFDLARFVPFAVVVLLLIPLQSATEELFFRGYVLQGLGQLSRQPLLLALVTGVLFALPHAANPEAKAAFWPVMLSLAIFGAALALVTLRDNGLELAIGAHIANNLFVALIANYEGSALETPAIFVSQFDPWFGLVSLVVVLALFYLLVFGLRRPAGR